MAYDDEDLFEEEFDFVDEEEDSDVEDSPVDELDSDVEEEEPSKPKRRSPRSSSSKGGGKQTAKKPVASDSEQEDDEFATEVDEPEEAAVPAGPPTDHVVHIYEFGDFKRTIQREFTDEDAIKFAEEFNRTSKNYGRHAVPVERDEEPEPHL
jgi:hypothetical protein